MEGLGQYPPCRCVETFVHVGGIRVSVLVLPIRVLRSYPWSKSFSLLRLASLPSFPLCIVLVLNLSPDFFSKNWNGCFRFHFFAHIFLTLFLVLSLPHANFEKRKTVHEFHEFPRKDKKNSATKDAEGKNEGHEFTRKTWKG